MIKYKIFVIFHNEIDISYYDKSIIENLVFVNVNPGNNYQNESLNIIDLHKFVNYIPLGKWYAESEVIYNIYKNEYLTNNLNYIGFVHYDVDLTPITADFLANKFNNYKLINLQPYKLRQDYDQNILMDPNYPNQLTGKYKNCYVGIFEDFNSYYLKDYNINSYLNNSIVNLCACFIVEKEEFYNMMPFIRPIIEDKRLDKYDTEHNYRIQGGLLERYYAVWFLLKNTKCFNINLDHNFIGTKNQQSYYKKLKGIFIDCLKKVRVFFKQFNNIVKD